ncbi:MAG: hypothetical protein JSW40_08435 [Candidatus Omnitrophota bacterium]|nr:MAG: hypothetical protein JSW40_08435 [Candidatus Omnitrophota bacterium]
MLEDRVILIILGAFVFAIGICRICLHPVNPFIFDIKKTFTFQKSYPTVRRSDPSYIMVKIINVVGGLFLSLLGILMICWVFCGLLR